MNNMTDGAGTGGFPDAGPYSARLLCDLGAEVVKVETLARLPRVSDAAVAPHRPAPGHGRPTPRARARRNR
ncbi:hypothetical protein FRACA_280038 [Frankia canadensis]|uniref:Formyl-CoA transferase n=1 Tax=Frankia canadensis TaxID=1836972 RepID=A0A2I2KT43_9ACTN|nr:hypothetical protein FRACA_280038 [Frankia canadensis]SOU56106.1 hypothetical protein FRACA_280038 [Frankia canadensis]